MRARVALVCRREWGEIFLCTPARCAAPRTRLWIRRTLRRVPRLDTNSGPRVRPPKVHLEELAEVWGEEDQPILGPLPLADPEGALAELDVERRADDLDDLAFFRGGSNHFVSVYLQPLCRGFRN